MTLVIQKPSWFDPYGEFSFVPSADGTVFWNMIGGGPDGFLVYLFRSFPDGRTERVPYSPALHHASLSLSPKGLFLSGFYQYSSREPKTIVTDIPVQGYVPFTTENINKLPPVITTQLNGVDDVARGNINDIRAIVNKKADDLNALYKQVQDHLTKHPSAGMNVTTGVSKSDVEAIAWQKANDALYAAMTSADTNSYVAETVRKFAPQVAAQPAPVDKAALVADVLAEIRKRLT